MLHLLWIKRWNLVVVLLEIPLLTRATCETGSSTLLFLLSSSLAFACIIYTAIYLIRINERIINRRWHGATVYRPACKSSQLVALSFSLSLNAAARKGVRNNGNAWAIFRDASRGELAGFVTLKGFHWY